MQEAKRTRTNNGEMELVTVVCDEPSSAGRTIQTNTAISGRDDTNLLPSDLTQKAQEKDLSLYRNFVCLKRCSEQRIGSRWVGVNKGDSDVPDVRMRLVAREFHAGPVRTDTFAGSPPLLVLRMFLNIVSSSCQSGENLLMLVAHAEVQFLRADGPGEVYVQPRPSVCALDGCWKLFIRHVWNSLCQSKLARQILDGDRFS